MTSLQLEETLKKQKNETSLDIKTLLWYIGGESQSSDIHTCKPINTDIDNDIQIKCSFEHCKKTISLSQEKYSSIKSKNQELLCKTHLEIKKLLKKKNLAKKYNKLHHDFNNATQTIQSLQKKLDSISQLNQKDISDLKNILSDFKISSQKDFESFDKEVDKYSLR